MPKSKGQLIMNLFIIFGLVLPTLLMLPTKTADASNSTISNTAQARGVTVISDSTPTPPSKVWIDASYNASSCGGHTWGYNAFNKIQAGIDNFSSTGTVYVAAGTYRENIILRDGVELVGAGNTSTIIDGMQHGSVVTAINISSATEIDGFAVINGSGTGAGMHNTNSSPTITNCTFQSNSASVGGGMYNEGSSPTITNCTFQSNSASLVAGGMYNGGSSPIVTNCIFQSNSNSGMINDGSSPAITNCIFQNNSGDGIWNFASSPTITNCDFWGNSGNGIQNELYTYPITITNCILWNDSLGEISNYNNLYTLITYCDIAGTLYPGIGNINTDPMFRDAADGDLHLTSGSPCIDTGNNSAPSIPATDMDGFPRIVDGNGDGITTVDMGADEYVPSITPVSGYWDVKYNVVNGSSVVLNYSWLE